MTTEENTRPTAATEERAKMEMATGQAAISCTHFITGDADRQSGFIANLRQRLSREV